MPHSENLAGTQSRFCQKKKKQSHLSRSQGRKVGETQTEQEPYLGERSISREKRNGKQRESP